MLHSADEPGWAAGEGDRSPVNLVSVACDTSGSVHSHNESGKTYCHAVLAVGTPGLVILLISPFAMHAFVHLH